MNFKEAESYYMTLRKIMSSGVLFGALSILMVDGYAGSPSGLTFQVGIGQANFDKDLNTSALVSQGYTVNGYSQNVVDKDSHSISLSVPISPKISAELGLQKMGEVKSSLDLTLPAGKSAKQAAEDIVDASPQQFGGIAVAIGANYVQPINQRLDLRLGGGVSIAKDDHRVTINGEEFDSDDTSVAPYLKLGFGVSLTPRFALTAHAEHYFFDDPVDRYEIGLSYTY